MKRIRLAALPLVALMLALSAGSAYAHDLRLHILRANGVDLTRLPIGDGKYSLTTASVGSIYLCAEPNTTQETIDAPWINGDGTFNATARPVIDGAVSWTSVFSAVLQGMSRVLSGNTLPPHTTGSFPIASTDDAYEYDRNPNSIEEGSISGSLTASPTLLSAPSCMGGEVGVALNGVTILNGLDSKGRDAVANELQDACGGHPNAGSLYHYHNLSPCLEDTGSGHSALIGYALDGFGIYGLRGEDGVELGNADLDECHGHTHVIEWDGVVTEMFHYHATNEYPYTVSCFRGRRTSLTGQQQGGATGATGQQRPGGTTGGQQQGGVPGQQGQGGQSGQQGQPSGQSGATGQGGQSNQSGQSGQQAQPSQGTQGGQPSGGQTGGQTGGQQSGGQQQGGQQGGPPSGGQSGGGQQSGGQQGGGPQAGGQQSGGGAPGGGGPGGGGPGGGGSGQRP